MTSALSALRVADAAEHPLDDDSCDVVFCQMGLVFMEGQGAALTEMRRVLAPDGRLAINASGRIQPGFELMEQALVEQISPDLGGFVRAVFSMHDPDVVAGLLRDAGFTDVSATEQISALDLPGPARPTSCGSTSTSPRWVSSSNRHPRRPRPPSSRW